MMTERQKWILSSFVIAVAGAGLVLFFTITKPDCPQGSKMQWTPQAWYCVVPPLR
jgi:hypothetical protein